eukprot:TRINITY_DN1964_c0_g1_i2.p1 TRINITY_DN1964_c0_g1~~TRINITY_DN1964_c0_g1_i2.p1  ORF type:complete len:182 (+),score=30.93 TRINITY_DN1964_c0_g1_i2:82-627(+)
MPSWREYGAQTLPTISVFTRTRYQSISGATPMTSHPLPSAPLPLPSLRSTVEKIKTETMDAKAKEKQTNKTEEALKAANRDMSMSKFKSMFATSLSMIILYNIISSAYSGIIVVKLPFTPFGLFQAMTHRNLPGTDYTDGSFIFVYVLSSMAFRPHLQKIFGFTPPKTLPGGGFFEMPKEN